MKAVKPQLIGVPKARQIGVRRSLALDLQKARLFDKRFLSKDQLTFCIPR
jgi:hypothetical protein